jgi:holin-like protein
MKIDHIRQKALFLKQNMAFFLVPSSVSIIQHIDLLKEIVIPLLVISMVSTILTFLATAFAVNLTMKLTQKKSSLPSAQNQGIENE